MDEPVGLNYVPLFALLDRYHAENWDAVFGDIRVIERAALDAIKASK